MPYNDYEQCPIKGDPKKVANPGLASGYNAGADAMPSGNPKQDVQTSTPQSIDEKFNDITSSRAGYE